MFLLYTEFYFLQFCFLKKLFLDLDLVMISFGSSFVIKDIWFPWVYFRFIEAKLFTASMHTLQNRCSPLLLITNSSLERLLVRELLETPIIDNPWFNFLKRFSRDSQSQQMKIWKPYFYYTSALKVTRNSIQNQINGRRAIWIFVISRASPSEGTERGHSSQRGTKSHLKKTQSHLNIQFPPGMTLL